MQLSSLYHISFLSPLFLRYYLLFSLSPSSHYSFPLLSLSSCQAPFLMFPQAIVFLSITITFSFYHYYLLFLFLLSNFSFYSSLLFLFWFSLFPSVPSHTTYKHVLSLSFCQALHWMIPMPSSFFPLLLHSFLFCILSPNILFPLSILFYFLSIPFPFALHFPSCCFLSFFPSHLPQKSFLLSLYSFKPLLLKKVPSCHHSHPSFLYHFSFHFHICLISSLCHLLLLHHPS